MNFIGSILQQISGISKSRKKFMIILLKAILSTPGKINFRNLSRFSKISEKTFSRNFRRAFSFLQMNLLLIKSIYKKTNNLLLVVDCSFITKSGKKTYGLGRFFNGCSRRAEKGLEIFVASLVDPVIKTAFSLLAFQTPAHMGVGKSNSSNNSDNETRIDFYLQCLKTVQNRITGMVKYCVADGFFAKSKFVDGVIDMSLHLICKLRSDANLKFIYKGKERKRGRPKQFDGKVKFNDLRKFHFVKKIVDNISLYTAVVYNVNLKRNIRIALLVNHRNKKKRSYIVLFTTDQDLSAEQIFDYYKSRFQIEFIFRDAKQYCGLCDCQSIKKESLDFHFNASLTTLNIAKVGALKSHKKNDDFIFSMASIKRVAYNENLMENIFSKLGFDLSLIKFQAVFKKFREYGAIAA
jgi:hypothetical protein